MPRIAVRPEGVDVVMPWDPGYAGIAGEGCDCGLEYPPHLTRRRSIVTVTGARSVRQ
jgi:hypothetical protein